MTPLERIVIHKKQQLVQLKQSCSLPMMKALAAARPTSDMRSFAQTMQQDGLRIIAEIKRASPSKGDITPDLDPETVAHLYELGGASALSVLTEDSGFKGSPTDLRAARAAVSIPVLRKDFLFDEYQIYESVAMGADALLLIVRILDQATLIRLMDLSLALGIEPLVEIHDDTEVERVKHLPCKLIGINNRNLGSFSMDMERASSLSSRLAPHQIPISLSGILSPEDIKPMLASGIRRFLIGEALSKSADPAAFLQSLAKITLEYETSLSRKTIR